ncbi:40S ribosomal protein S25-3-like [Hibiscus syriacus]|uniref:40S ribosomal protein S25-3-like n=1 Tax=Hibiscus syriacus TaxID=106335 RepID=A0A6A2YJF4_HIBSY|nr:40S ribosomal protein S25-3-like [Hibiscus syriacus]
MLVGLEGSEEEILHARRVYVAAVDLLCEIFDLYKSSFFFAPSEEFLELTKSALQAAPEALAPESLFGLATFSHQGLIPVCYILLSSLYITAARVFAFLSGPPDHGPGQLDTRRYGEQYACKGEDTDRALLPEQTPFYKDLAAVAVQAGVCVDIFAITNEYTDLASLKFPSIESSGFLFLYSNTEDLTLPQDMYRMLSRPYAFNCVLRLRTFTEFKPGHSYDHFFPDPQYENVQHIICCDSYATYAYHFDFTNDVGFSRAASEQPMLQIAFQYTVVVPPKELSGSELISSIRYIIPSGYSVPLSLLPALSVIFTSLEEGVREGRMLFHDWLVILTTQYNEAFELIQYKNGSSSMTSQVDVTFSQCPQLQLLPRLVFALLRNPLLLFHEEGVHPDYRIYVQCLFSALEPSSLHRAIYPVLTSYSTPDKQAYPRHSLSHAALITSGSPIFFLDAFTTLIVFYSSTADPSIPFPPPQDKRCITPKLVFIRGGQDDATAFENYLIEEQDVDGIGLTSVAGFVSFLEDITQSVLEYMK